MSSPHLDLAGHVEHFRTRVLQDALAEATADYWHRRAAQFDYAAQAATPGSNIHDRCAQAAKLCRHRATLALGGDCGNS